MTHPSCVRMVEHLIMSRGGGRPQLNNEHPRRRSINLSSHFCPQTSFTTGPVRGHIFKDTSEAVFCRAECVLVCEHKPVDALQGLSFSEAHHGAQNGES